MREDKQRGEIKASTNNLAIVCAESHTPKPEILVVGS
jgi:hypothetical protein